MIIFNDVINEKTTIALSDFGFDVEKGFKYNNKRCIEEYTIVLPFADTDKVTEIFKDTVNALAAENGYYGNEFNDKPVEYSVVIEFVYSFDSDTKEIAIWIEPVSKADTEFLDEAMTIAYFTSELDADDEIYLRKSLAEIIYNA